MSRRRIIAAFAIGAAAAALAAGLYYHQNGDISGLLGRIGKDPPQK